MKKYYYTGIGSRETPKSILTFMYYTAKFLSVKGFILRSGGANGADLAFEKGVDSVKGDKEIYLPWEQFNDSSSELIVKNEQAFQIAEDIHPYWNNLSEGARKLQARNSHQVLGKDLRTPSAFLLCYTSEGKGRGGTGQAIRLANELKIDVFDFGLYEEDFERLKKELRNFLQKQLS